MRGLSPKFIGDLKNGCLEKVLECVKSDDTLSLCIRDEYINIYYRGGSLYKIIEKSNGVYDFDFDTNYCNHNKPYFHSKKINLPKTTKYEEYVNLIYDIKREMDIYFSENPKSEKEFQQLVLRENNMSSISNYTDYYIADIEYAYDNSKSRLDLIGVKWPSKREPHINLQLSIMEMKYGDKALTGGSGIVDHFDKLNKFIATSKLNVTNSNNLYDEVENILNQKIELGVIDIHGNKKVQLDKNAKLEYIIIAANHKPQSTVLERELNIAKNNYPKLFQDIDVKITTEANIGYGLFDKAMKYV